MMGVLVLLYLQAAEKIVFQEREPLWGPVHLQESQKMQHLQRGPPFCCHLHCPVEGGYIFYVRLSLSQVAHVALPTVQALEDHFGGYHLKDWLKASPALITRLFHPIVLQPVCYLIPKLTK
ncbi:hypothetical protein FKM82_024227 [Ascaphus truei]